MESILKGITLNFSKNGEEIVPVKIKQLKNTEYEDE